MTGELPVYLDDLKSEARKRVMEFLVIKAPADLNLDVLPLFVLPKPERHPKK